MKKITIAVDSFKGSLSSREVADAFEAGICDIVPECKINKVVIADGGEGTIEALTERVGGKEVVVTVCDPLLRPVQARYNITNEGIAIMEMAAASGLTLLKTEERNPLKTSTFGTGEMILDAIKRGCRKFLIGIGGSATNDGGTGMLQALGFRFLDCNGETLDGCGETLERIATIDDSEVVGAIKECNFTIACDVRNPLYGEQGAAYVFAPQKGADIAMVEQLDRGLRNYARVVEKFNGTQIGNLAGAGAAGGLGGGFYALLHAELKHGIAIVLEAIAFDQIIKGSDLVITGEGRIDNQTLMGKVPSGVLAVAQRQKIATIAIGGGIEWCEELHSSGFAAIVAVTPDGMALDKAMLPAVAQENVRRTAREIARSYLID